MLLNDGQSLVPTPMEVWGGAPPGRSGVEDEMEEGASERGGDICDGYSPSESDNASIMTVGSIKGRGKRDEDIRNSYYEARGGRREGGGGDEVTWCYLVLGVDVNCPLLKCARIYSCLFLAVQRG